MAANPLFLHSVWGVLIILIILTNKYAELDKISTQKTITHPATPSIEANAPKNENQQNEDIQAPQQIRNAITVSNGVPVKNPHIESNGSESYTKAMNEHDLQQKTIAELNKIIGGSELHYIGVYESNAREYTLEEERKHYSECNKNTNASISSKQGSDCWDYAYRAEKNVENTVTVNINSNKNISLVLTSYKPVKWVITGNIQKLKLIYISGNKVSEMSKYFHPPTKVYSSFYDKGMCSYCLNSNLPSFYGYEQTGDVLQKINQYFQTPISSFQGGYKAKSFYIN